MSGAGWDGVQGGRPQYGPLPTGGGRLERLRLTLLGIACLTPLPLVAIVQLGLVLMSDAPRSAADVVEISVGLAEIAIIGAQVVTLVGPARSSIVGDQIYLPRLARTRRVMTFLSVPVLIVALPLTVVQGILMGLLGLVFNVFLFAIGVFGLIGRYQLRKLEVLAARAGHGGAGQLRPHGDAPPPPPRR